MATRAYPAAYSRSCRPSQVTLHVEKLLKRYPNLSEEELASLIETFPQLTMLDAALLTADDRLSSTLEVFHRDQGQKLRTPLPFLGAMVAVPAMLLIVLVYWLLT